jgi:hypothetical protein
MSELESLFLVVLLVYLVQCLYWVTPGAAVFVLNFRGQGRWKHRGFAWSALKSEGFLAGPLPPLSPLAAQVWPAFLLNADGVGISLPNAEWKSLPWDGLAISASESKLRCQGVTVFHGSEGQVLEFSQLFGKLQRAAKNARGSMIERWLRQAMRAETPRRRVRVFSGRSRLLRILANAQLVFLFVVGPLLFGRFGPSVLWRILLFLLTMQLLIGLEFWSVHKRLFPSASSARLKATVTVLLSPMAAIRSCDVVARDLFGGSHPLAVAAAVLPLPEFEIFAGEQLRQWRFGDHPDSWYRDVVATALERAIRRAGVRPESLLRPAQRENECVVYCPRCLAQYVKNSEACSDCGFESLVPFSGKAQSAKAGR